VLVVRGVSESESEDGISRGRGCGWAVGAGVEAVDMGNGKRGDSGVLDGSTVRALLLVVSGMGREGRRDRLTGWQPEGETMNLGGLIFLVAVVIYARGDYSGDWGG
jgi:hypothetical protein